jgi:hypothetical protein
MTQRKLTKKELEAALRAYLELGELHGLPDSSIVADMCVWLTLRIQHNTTDGKPPTPVERVPTAADIGRRVKVREDDYDPWLHGRRLVGFVDGRFVTINESRGYASWKFCIIDEEAGQ